MVDSLLRTLAEFADIFFSVVFLVFIATLLTTKSTSVENIVSF